MNQQGEIKMNEYVCFGAACVAGIIAIGCGLMCFLLYKKMTELKNKMDVLAEKQAEFQFEYCPHFRKNFCYEQFTENRYNA